MLFNNTKIYKCYTLGEIFVIMTAIILLFYYVYSVRNNKLNNTIDNSDDVVPDIEQFGSISSETTQDNNLIELNEIKDTNIDKIINVNRNRNFNRTNYNLWYPKFISLKFDKSDIDKIKQINNADKIFNYVIFPKLYVQIDILVKRMENLKNNVSNKNVQTGIDIYNKYLKLYIVYYIYINFNLMNKSKLEELINLEDSIKKLQDLIMN